MNRGGLLRIVLRNMIYGKTRELPAYKRVFTERLSRAAKLRHIIKINTASRLSGAFGESGYGKPNTETARGSTLQDFHGSVYGAICYLYGSHVTPRVYFLIPAYEKRSVILVGASAARIIHGRFINFHSRSIRYEISRSLRRRRFWKDNQEFVPVHNKAFWKNANGRFISILVENFNAKILFV